jgi:hypothetical protein
VKFALHLRGPTLATSAAEHAIPEPTLLLNDILEDLSFNATGEASISPQGDELV